MPRQHTGSIIKKGNKIYARLQYIDEQGQRREKKRRADNRTHAKEIINKLLRELDQHGATTLDAAGMTFSQLATHCIEKYFCEAQYDSEGRKITGVRGRAEAFAAINPLIEYFGKMKLRNITHAHIAAYRGVRLLTITKRNTIRSIATVNRELSKLRRMMNIAERAGWIIKSPFTKGDSLISTADERQRERILTREEEARLLAACDQPKRKHLYALVVAALDTGARQGELFGLRWSDVNLEDRLLRVTSYKGKSVQRRELYITNRLLVELEKLQAAKIDADSNGLVFGITDNVKWSFRMARHEAGLEGLRFHDLRHTAATRLVNRHIPLSEVGRVLGHSNPTTTYRYVNATPEIIRRAGLALDAFNDEEPNNPVEAPNLIN